jgi:hypothetical protein
MWNQNGTIVIYFLEQKPKVLHKSKEPTNNLDRVLSYHAQIKLYTMCTLAKYQIGG